MYTALRNIALACLLLLPVLHGAAQQNVPTKGTDFWVGFMQNFLDGMPGETLELFVTSDVTTTGTVTIPGQGWSESFDVTANTTTTIPLPVELAECRIDDLVEGRGVHVLTADTVSVFAMNLEPYTADGTKVLPVPSLGTRYRVSSYEATGPAGSELLVVATEDGTAVSITPTAPTLGGHVADVPFVINLNAGETYLVQAESPHDLTGTLVEAAPSSGGCRPFAVFSGATCASVPTNCAACDHMFEQNFPISTWGTSYQAVPFLGPESYSLRVLADAATTVTINGIPHVMNTGEVLEFNELSGPQCIEATSPVQAIQLMEGVECGGQGDPAMLVLNSQEQEIDAITFSTVSSTVITNHALTLLTDASNTGNVFLDGTAISPALFESFPNCPSRAYVRLARVAGAHHLESDGMFTAYVYGNGFAESYAYSAGSFARSETEEIETLCFSEGLVLDADPALTDVAWFVLPDSLNEVGVGNTLNLDPPFASGTYQAAGTWNISGCPHTQAFEVEYAEVPTVSFEPAEPSICIFDTLHASVNITTDITDFNVWWNAEYGLADTLSLTPDLLPQTSTVYTLNFATPGGCIEEEYSYVVEVIEEDPSFDLGEDQLLCAGDTLEMHVPLPTTWSYDWSNGAPNSPDADLVADGTHFLTVTSPGGCAHTDSVALAHSPLPNPSWNPIPAFCEGDSIQLVLPEDDWNVTWADGETGPRWLTDESLQSYTVNDPLGCQFSGAVSPELWASPQLFVPDEVYACSGDFVTIEALAENVSYLWEDGTTGTSASTQNPGYFGVTVTNSQWCSTTDSTLVELVDRPDINLGPDQILCEGESTWIVAGDAGSGYQYDWSNGSTQPFIQVSESGTFSVTASNGVCTDSDQILVNVVPAPERPFPADSTWCFEDQPILLYAFNPGNQYLWSNGSTASQTTLSQPGIAGVTITTPLGCVSTFDIDIQSFCTEASLYLPNAFTPDGDGVNDTFGAEGSSIGQFEMRIWNRWGDEIWSTNSLEGRWDGTGDRRAKHGESEVYVFSITYTTLLDKDGKESFPQEKRGFVTVVR